MDSREGEGNHFRSTPYVFPGGCLFGTAGAFISNPGLGVIIPGDCGVTGVPGVVISGAPGTTGCSRLDLGLSAGGPGDRSRSGSLNAGEVGDCHGGIASGLISRDLLRDRSSGASIPGGFRSSCRISRLSGVAPVSSDGNPGVHPGMLSGEPEPFTSCPQAQPVHAATIKIIIRTAPGIFVFMTFSFSLPLLFKYLSLTVSSIMIILISSLRIPDMEYGKKMTPAVLDMIQHCIVRVSRRYG